MVEIPRCVRRSCRDKSVTRPAYIGRPCSRRVTLVQLRFRRVAQSQELVECAARGGCA
jgi:hypothetical protein